MYCLYELVNNRFFQALKIYFIYIIHTIINTAKLMVEHLPFNYHFFCTSDSPTSKRLFVCMQIFSRCGGNKPPLLIFQYRGKLKRLFYQITNNVLLLYRFPNVISVFNGKNLFVHSIEGEGMGAIVILAYSEFYFIREQENLL